MNTVFAEAVETWNRAKARAAELREADDAFGAVEVLREAWSQVERVVLRCDEEPALAYVKTYDDWRKIEKTEAARDAWRRARMKVYRIRYKMRAEAERAALG